MSEKIKYYWISYFYESEDEGGYGNMDLRWSGVFSSSEIAQYIEESENIKNVTVIFWRETNKEHYDQIYNEALNQITEEGLA